MENEAPGRLGYFDKLRYLLVFGVVLLHAACAYSRFTPWWFAKDEQSVAADVLLAALDVFLMPFLFFIAGYFAPFSLAAKGKAEFIKRKARRLLIPFFLLTFFYLPVMPWLSAVSTNADAPGFFTYWLRSLAILTDFSPHLVSTLEDARRFQDVLSPHLLWFLSLLFLFFGGYALIAGRTPFPAHSRPSVRRFWLVGFCASAAMVVAVAGIVSFIPALSWVRWNALILFQPARAPLYLGLFLLGVWSARNGWLRDRPFPGPTWLWLTGFVVFLAGTLVASGPLYATGRPDFTVITAYAAFFVLANCCLVVFGCNVFMRRMRKSSRLSAFLADGSYDVYLLHMPLAAALEIGLVQSEMAPLAKLFLVFVLSLAVSLGLGAWLVRPRPKVAAALLVVCFVGLCLATG